VHEPVPRLPEGLERWQDLIDRAMAKDPDLRFADCAAFIEGLRETAPDEFAAVMKKDGVAAVAPLAPAQRSAKSPAKPPAKSPDKPPSKSSSQSSPKQAVSAPEPAAAPVSADKADNGARPSMIRVASQVPSRIPIFVAAGLILAGLGMGAAYWLTREDAPVPAVVANSVAPTTTKPSVTEPDTEIDPESGPTSEPDTDPDATSAPLDGEPGDSVAPIDGEIESSQEIALGELPTVEDPVKRLLAMGRANLAALRLTTPPVNNALDRYKLVLLFEPKNRDALEGIASVSQAYVDLAAKLDRETALAEWLENLERAESIAREYQASEALAAAGRLRSAYVEDLLKRGSAAIDTWQREEAIGLHRRALQVLPDSEAAKRGLRRAEQVGQTGYIKCGRSTLLGYFNAVQCFLVCFVHHLPRNLSFFCRAVPPRRVICYLGLPAMQKLVLSGEAIFSTHFTRECSCGFENMHLFNSEY
jgi:hypothetical protein